MDLRGQVCRHRPGFLRSPCKQACQIAVRAHHHGQACAGSGDQGSSHVHQGPNRGGFESDDLGARHDGAEPMKEMQEIPAGDSGKEILVPAGEPDNLMGENRAQNQNQVILEDGRVDDDVHALMKDPAREGVDLLCRNRSDLPQGRRNVPSMVEKPNAGEHLFPLACGNPEKRIDSFFAEDCMGPEGHHEIQLRCAPANDVPDYPRHERQRARPCGVRGKHKDATAFDELRWNPFFHDGSDIRFREPCLCAPASCRHGALPSLLSRILENLSQKKSTGGSVYHQSWLGYIPTGGKFHFPEFSLPFRSPGAIRLPVRFRSYRESPQRGRAGRSSGDRGFSPCR